jgi:hypothetical protein
MRATRTIRRQAAYATCRVADAAMPLYAATPGWLMPSLLMPPRCRQHDFL